ncbi:hypothetical protein SBOR_0407 [Sclerotinia borealis F-4128]|uniref:Uncharacterized protein n=1 Tax=Sclerotinia borealis (strain F-4128) TaxID=1432307 RepID=W9CX78_SCLBF|nr:hypothetical protein SBOR_0407 [Sclerotinia borealis F-4128]
MSTASDYDGLINGSRDPRIEFGFRVPFVYILGLDHRTQNADGQQCVLLQGKAKTLWNFCGDIPGSTARRTLAFAKSSVYWACDEDTHGEQPEWGGI